MASSAPNSSGVPARKGRARRPSVARRPAAAGAGRIHKELGWMGVRERLWGGYAAEIRIPSSRSRVWVGKFQHAVQAALAYDAAMYCFYGNKLPKLRKYNFPEVRHPKIPEEWRRAGLTVANVKAIAEKHARDFPGFVPPPVIPAPAASPALQVAEAGGAAAGAGVAGDAAAAAGAGATAADKQGDDVVYIDAEMLTSDDLVQFSCNPGDFARVMDMDMMDLIFGDI